MAEKRVLFFRGQSPFSAALQVVLFAKAHVDQYTRADGTVVQAHDDGRQAAAPPPIAGGGKPDLGAGLWREGHKVKGGGVSGEVVGKGKERGHVIVKTGAGSFSVHGADLKPADGHGWPDAGTHEQSGPAGAKGGAVNPVNHPKGIKPGGKVFFPHPSKPGKNGLGTYKGERNGKSVVAHESGEHEVDHANVKPARGIPKAADPVATAAAGQYVRDQQRLAAQGKTGG